MRLTQRTVSLTDECVGHLHRTVKYHDFVKHNLRILPLECAAHSQCPGTFSSFLSSSIHMISAVESYHCPILITFHQQNILIDDSASTCSRFFRPVQLPSSMFIIFQNFAPQTFFILLHIISFPCLRIHTRTSSRDVRGGVGRLDVRWSNARWGGATRFLSE